MKPFYKALECTFSATGTNLDTLESCFHFDNIAFNIKTTHIECLPCNQV